MPRPTRTPPSQWIEEGLRALAVGGPDAVRVEALARELGVTKGGFYNHFTDRPELLTEMLNTWEQVGVDAVIDHVEREGGDARTKLDRLFTSVMATGDLVRIDLAVRDWAQRDQTVAQRLKQVDNLRMDYMRALFACFCPEPEEVEVRCLVAYSLFIAPPRIAADDHMISAAAVRSLALSRLLM